MFKRYICVCLVLSALILSLCACSKTTLYLPLKTDCYENDTLVYSLIYTYNQNGDILSEASIYYFSPESTEVNNFNYSDKGELVSLTTVIADTETVYTAEKITKYKYIFTSLDNQKITVIFDGKGHIVYKAVDNAYTLENVYTYDESGKPTSLKKQTVYPSGSNKLTEYIITFTGRDTYDYFEVGNDSVRYSVSCQILKQG